MPMKDQLKMDERTRHWATIDGRGIKWNHCYTILDARPITLANGWTDIIVLMRNPWGKDQRGDQWTGDWSYSSDLWTKHTKKQVDQAARLTSEATFWMSMQDLLDMFKSVTINHTDLTYALRVIPADVVQPGFESDQEADDWAVMHLRCQQNAPLMFFRICQMDRKFLENEEEITTYEYPQVTMIVVKKARLPPKTEYSTATVEFAYLEGVQGKLPSLGVRVNFFRKGDYYILYKVDYQEGQN